MNLEVKKIFINTLAQLMGKAFSAGTTVATTALIARQYGGADFGAFFLMTGFAAYFYLLTDFGLNIITARALAGESENREKLARYFSTLFIFRFFFSLILVLVLVVVVWLIPFRLENLKMVRLGITIGLLTILAQGLYNSTTAIFQPLLAYEKTVVASIAGNSIFLLLVLLLVSRKANVLTLVAANTFGTVLVSLVAFLFLKRILGRITWQWDRDLLRQLISEAWPLGLGIVLTVVVAKADQFLLSVLPLRSDLLLSNDLALGNYGLAYKIFENLLVFPTYFSNAFFPILVTNRLGGSLRFGRVFGWGLAFLIVASIVVIFVGLPLAPWAIGVIGGQEFRLAPQVLRLLLLSLPLFFASALLLFLLIAQGQQRLVPWIYLAAAIFNVGLNLIFIPSHGIQAAAIITGLTELLILLLMIYPAGRGFHKDFVKTVTPRAS